MLEIPEAVLEDAAVDENGGDRLELELIADVLMELVPLVVDEVVPESPLVVEEYGLPDKFKLEEVVVEDGTESEDDVDV